MIRCPCLSPRLAERLGGLACSLSALLCRWSAAATFWRSGRTKVHGLFSLNDSTYFLFRDEYKVPLIPPDIAAVMAATAEHLFSILLFVGLASRLSALGLFAMTLVIQIFVYPQNWPDHILWAAVLVTVAARGPGAWSLDRLAWPWLLRCGDKGPS
jgi:putative oxidoreductase